MRYKYVQQALLMMGPRRGKRTATHATIKHHQRVNKAALIVAFLAITVFLVRTQNTLYPKGSREEVRE